jgi:hypothetical protein
MKFNFKLIIYLLAVSFLACNGGDKNATLKINVKNNKVKQAIYVDLLELDGEPVAVDTAAQSADIENMEDQVAKRMQTVRKARKCKTMEISKH